MTAGDVMDDQPVAIPAATTVLAAEDEYFLRYRWPWFAVVDEDGRFRGVVARGAGPGGDPRRPAGADGRRADRAGRRATSAAVPRDTPVEAMLGLEALRRLGAVMVVDTDQRLCGVVTAEQLSRAIAAAATPQR